MDKDARKLLPSKASGSLTNGANANASLATAYSQKLTMAEALESVGKMLMAYPNARDGLRDGYVGVIARTLLDYPRNVALQCADPVNGVTRKTKFLPTVADVVAWCEHEQEPYRTASNWEYNTRKQFALRDQIEREEKDEPLQKRKEVAQRIIHELAERFKLNAQPAGDHWVGPFERAGDKWNPKLRSSEAATNSAPPKTQSHWRRFTDDELRAIYPTPRTGP